PIMALAIVGMPVGRLPVETIGRILAGRASVCAVAGIPVAGGHSIDSVQPLYGLAALGLVHPDQVMPNDAARPGDVLILTKALGAELAARPGVHAMTDVTGFGLLGHALEMARGAGATIRLDPSAAPLLPGVEALAREGVRTGASGRNWASYGEAVEGADALPDWRRDLLTDPQTSGGLLVAVAEAEASAALDHIRAAGFDLAAIVGRVASGPPVVQLA